NRSVQIDCFRLSPLRLSSHHPMGNTYSVLCHQQVLSEGANSFIGRELLVPVAGLSCGRQHLHYEYGIDQGVNSANVLEPQLPTPPRDVRMAVGLDCRRLHSDVRCECDTWTAFQSLSDSVMHVPRYKTVCLCPAAHAHYFAVPVFVTGIAGLFEREVFVQA